MIGCSGYVTSYYYTVAVVVARRAKAELETGQETGRHEKLIERAINCGKLENNAFPPKSFGGCESRSICQTRSKPAWASRVGKFVNASLLGLMVSATAHEFFRYSTRLPFGEWGIPRGVTQAGMPQGKNYQSSSSGSMRVIPNVRTIYVWTSVIY